MSIKKLRRKLEEAVTARFERDVPLYLTPSLTIEAKSAPEIVGGREMYKMEATIFAACAIDRNSKENLDIAKRATVDYIINFLTADIRESLVEIRAAAYSENTPLMIELSRKMLSDLSAR